jgi:hypothetical protein
VLNAEEGSVLALDLLQSLENEPFNSTGAQSKGVPQEFIDSLERVPLKNLPQKETADCPICTNRFVDDDYPLLVKLPCSVQHSAGKVAKDHIFDLECIGPWLKVNSTCPLCRFDVLEVILIVKICSWTSLVATMWCYQKFRKIVTSFDLGTI